MHFERLLYYSTYKGNPVILSHLVFPLSIPSGPTTRLKMCAPTWASTADRGSSRRNRSPSLYTALYIQIYYLLYIFFKKISGKFILVGIFSPGHADPLLLPAGQVDALLADLSLGKPKKKTIFQRNKINK